MSLDAEQGLSLGAIRPCIGGEEWRELGTLIPGARHVDAYGCRRYFDDEFVAPSPLEAEWAAGRINPTSLIIGHTSKDGTAGFSNMPRDVSYT